ncbi:hypothetical protein [Streptomyces tsukubensis]|nr:hypothetical protein [Streptomyces tsukubensis]QFR94573.1 hypothetical protein GBW32_17895 [Streptomyces tsukubensis]
MPNIETTPVIEFYGKKGEMDYKGEFTLTPGLHDFRNNSLPNDDTYSFSVKNPQPGYTITIYNSATGSEDESWASYKLTDPFPMDPTRRINVDAGYQVPIGQEIVPGVRANGHGAMAQLTGKVSSVRVAKDTTS